MESEESLPLFGVGPFLVGPVIVISIIALVLSIYEMIPVYRIDGLWMILIVLGIILIIIGAALWLSAVLKSRIDDKIKENKLVTSGVYSYVRHPIYSAFLFASSGLILISQNIYLFVLPVIYWAFLSIAMKRTEEKWLLDKFGKEYEEYSKKVNRFIPLRF